MARPPSLAKQVPPNSSSLRASKPRKRRSRCPRMLDVVYDVPATDDETDRPKKTDARPRKRAVPTAVEAAGVRPSKSKCDRPWELPRLPVPPLESTSVRRAMSPPLPTPTSATPPNPVVGQRGQTTIAKQPGGGPARPGQAPRVGHGCPTVSNNPWKRQPSKRTADVPLDLGTAKRPRHGSKTAGGPEVLSRSLSVKVTRTPNPVRPTSTSSSKGGRWGVPAVKSSSSAAVEQERRPRGGSPNAESSTSTSSGFEYWPKFPTLRAAAAVGLDVDRSSDDSSSDGSSSDDTDVEDVEEASGRVEASPELGQVRAGICEEARQAVIKIKTEPRESEDIGTASHCWQAGRRGLLDGGGDDDGIDVDELPEIHFATDGRSYRMVQGKPTKYPDASATDCCSR